MSTPDSEKRNPFGDQHGVEMLAGDGLGACRYPVSSLLSCHTERLVGPQQEEALRDAMRHHLALAVIGPLSSLEASTASFVVRTYQQNI